MFFQHFKNICHTYGKKFLPQFKSQIRFFLHNCKVLYVFIIFCSFIRTACARAWCVLATRAPHARCWRREAPEEAAREAILDYGQAVKDLAATNIFPGDMLLKNFGVTRHGRVVFYDYDELCLLTDCNFRELPQSDDVDEEMSAEPWFYVSPNDIFPEEFIRFFGLPPHLREAFLQTHGDLLNVEFWTQMQERHRAGEVVDIFSYKQSKRLRPPMVGRK